MNLKVLSATWFTEATSSRPIGIIVCKDELTSDIHAYIGTGFGLNENIDTDSIIHYGAKVHESMIASILAKFKGE